MTSSRDWQNYEQEILQWSLDTVESGYLQLFRSKKIIAKSRTSPITKLYVFFCHIACMDNSINNLNNHLTESERCLLSFHDDLVMMIKNPIQQKNRVYDGFTHQ